MSSSVDLVKMDGRGWLCRRAPQIQQALEVGHYEGSWEDEARKAAHGQAPRSDGSGGQKRSIPSRKKNHFSDPMVTGFVSSSRPWDS
ncbi:hypothetical protein PVAP13_8KG076900 [Panicum virgatum]|uniref:Uncharacterized protein n=1 Tax=Panicum virgatum TaxID=38727 RepID=A0A8T0PIC0_PANVG|nr:hypothetical protein PVAP13_8KG076900 [Panicum virgatum]